MKETIRTILLLALLVVSLGFMYWIGQQSESALGLGAQTVASLLTS